MTTPVYYNPEHLTYDQLDTLLSLGWYRMHQSVFTTNYIFIDGRTLRVFWLRYPLQAFQFSKKQQRLFRQNAGFTIINKPIVLTDELEDLYVHYKSSLSFEPATTIAEWLFGEERDKNIFDTHAIEVRDGDSLIAVGIYDLGKNSIAGIMNFYNPDYKKFSLGKYLVLLKAKHAMATNRHWYYPGYITYGYPAFDYKLFLGEENIEMFVPELNGWQGYNKTLVDHLTSNM